MNPGEKTFPPLRLIELFTSHGSDMITNPTHKVKWKVKWFHCEVILCWCWTCIASVYQLMWSSLLFSSLALVSLVICRGGERERERCAVSWLSFTSGALVLAAGSSVFFVIPFFLFFILVYLDVLLHSKAQFCRETKMQAYFYWMHSASVNTFCGHLHITKACCRMVTVVLFAVNLYLCVYCLCAYIFMCIYCISIIDLGASRCRPIQKF